MEIKPPKNDLYTAISRSVTATSQNNLGNNVSSDWKVSQLLDAIITKITDKQLFLDIQGIKANTLKPTNIDLQIGDTLKLQIEQLKPMPQFRVIRFQTPTNINVQSDTTRNLISDSNQTAALLKNISFVANRPALRPSPLAADTNAAVRDLVKQLPSIINLKTASQVKNQLQNSGLFIESKIKNQILSSIQHMQINKISSNKVNVNIKPLLENDLGVLLHRIANLIRTQPTMTKHIPTPAHPSTHNKVAAQQQSRIATEQASLQNITLREEAMQTFLRQIESSLTHMQQTQLQTLNESQTGRPVWLMELPVKNCQDIDLFELRIEQDETAQADGERKKIWNITLKFDLTGLGKIKAHITMQNDVISAQFYSEKPEILGLFRENFDLLRNKLSCNGLNVGTIECARANLNRSLQPENASPLDEKL